MFLLSHQAAFQPLLRLMPSIHSPDRRGSPLLRAMAVPFSLERAHDRGARESRRLRPKDRVVYADADNKLPKLQLVWQGSAICLPRAPTISGPNFLVEESPVSSVAIFVLGRVRRQITKSHVYTG